MERTVHAAPASSRRRSARARRARGLGGSRRSRGSSARAARRCWPSSWAAAQRSWAAPAARIRSRLGGKADLLRLILRQERTLQEAHIEPLARLTGLDAEAREYLRRLVALQLAGPKEAEQAQRSVWEIFAVKQGVPPAELARVARPEPEAGPVELALLPALPILAELPGVTLSPDGLERPLELPPSPSALASLCARWRQGARAGQVEGARFATLGDPGLDGDLEAEDALATLDALGLLDAVTRRPRPLAASRVPEAEEVPRLAAFRMHESVLDLLRTELLFPAPDRRAQAFVFALPDRAWAEVLELIGRYKAELHVAFQAATDRSQPDRVVINATQLFPLARRP